MKDLMEEFKKGSIDKGYVVKCNECIYNKSCDHSGKASDECNFPSYEEYFARDIGETDEELKNRIKKTLEG